MVTVTANDSNSEMLAAIRRGPLARPTPTEHIEYLLQRKRRDQERPPFEHFSLEHTLSFQRRAAWLTLACALLCLFFYSGGRRPLAI